VYLAPAGATGAPGQVVGIFNSVWGAFPAAVSWQSTLDESRQDIAGKPPPALG